MSTLKLGLALLLGCLPFGTARGAQTGDEKSVSPSAPAPPPCSAPETRQFAFWVGEWDAKWEGGHGTNSVKYVLGDCVVYESFADADEAGLKGWSLSTYNPRLQKWQQTWVDDTGAYLDFVGEIRDGRMVLSREAGAEGKRFLQDSFDWSWERSDDNGKTWRALWKIAYTRRK